MESPIGLFDSGFGGLTVMREVARLLPFEHLIYFGDTARVPYGNKSPETILQFAIENATFLLEKKIKLLLIPCHTACSHALLTLQKILPIPVLGVLEPGLNLIAPYSKIAILGTASTIQSGIYQSLIQEKNPKATLFACPCPLFVPLVEEGFHHHLAASLIAESYLGSLRGKIEAALLACTHYPLLRAVIQTALGPTVTLIEPAEECARKARALLAQKNLLNPQIQKPRYQFVVSDDPDKFRTLGKIFLGTEIETVVKK